MQLVVKGKCIGIYERPPFIDKKTGELQPSVYGLQLISEIKLKNGALKAELYDIKMDEQTSKIIKVKKIAILN